MTSKEHINKKRDQLLLISFVRWARLELAQDYSHYPLKVACLPISPPELLRAENGTRTRDPDLGKVVLYQLSYFRNSAFYYVLERLFSKALQR